MERLAEVASAATGTPEALIPDMKFMDISVNIHALLSTYFFYDGSLSTPPCSSKVTWLVLKTVFSVKSEHLAMIQKVLPVNCTSQEPHPVHPPHQPPRPRPRSAAGMPVCRILADFFVSMLADHGGALVFVFRQEGTENARSLQPLNGRGLSVAGTIQL